MRSVGTDIETGNAEVSADTGCFLLLSRISLQVVRLGKQGGVFLHQSILQLMDINPLSSNVT